MKLERSESRNAAACAISSAAAMRFIGCNPAMNSRAAGFPSPPAGVIVPPGNSALTRIFSDACSDASDCTRPSRTAFDAAYAPIPGIRSEEHTSEIQSLMRTSYAVFFLKKKKYKQITHTIETYAKQIYKHHIINPNKAINP